MASVCQCRLSYTCRMVQGLIDSFIGRRGYINRHLTILGYGLQMRLCVHCDQSMESVFYFCDT